MFSFYPPNPYVNTVKLRQEDMNKILVRLQELEAIKLSQYKEIKAFNRDLIEYINEEAETE